MTVKPEEAKAALVETAVAHVRERLSEPQCSDIADFLRPYYAEAALEDLAGLDLYGAALSHWHLLERRRRARPTFTSTRRGSKTTAGGGCAQVAV